MIKKFRIWDKLAQIFIYPDKGYQGHYFIDLNGRFHNFQNGSGGDECVVQQYTGLQDSENREIYEGDILEFLGPEDFNAHYGQIYFEDGMFKATEHGTLYSWAECSQWISVVGNIFQNPELLEKS